MKAVTHSPARLVRREFGRGVGVGGCVGGWCVGEVKE